MIIQPERRRHWRGLSEALSAPPRFRPRSRMPIHLRSLPGGRRRADPPFDPSLAIDAIRLAAGRLTHVIGTIQTELERDRMWDADPERDDGAVRRVAILEHALEVAQTGTISFQVALSTLAPRLAAVERLQVEAGDIEAMLLLLGREIDRAPWGVADGRIELLGELVTTATEAARLARNGLGAIAERLTSA